MERKLIGSVGVDSGQLMIMDPCYVKSHWLKGEMILGVKFWGEAAEDIISHMREVHGFVVTGEHPAFIETFADDEAAVVEELIKDEARRINKKIITSFETNSTYDKICDVTSREDQAGEIVNNGLLNIGVAFSSGLGDGEYDVYATYKDIEGCGRRITKVEIELIPDNFEEEE